MLTTMPPLGNKHIVSARQFSRDWLENFFRQVDLLISNKGMIRQIREYHAHEGTAVYLLFYEASTRTRFSFAHAANDLGMAVIETENAREFSSAVKGESLEDTIRVCCEYGPRVIVLRHPELFSANLAVSVIERWGYNTRVINAGDGANEHPTQALTDLYTIWREIGRLDDLHVVIGGDLLYGRTARSLIFELALYRNIRLTLVSPRSHRIPDDVRSFLLERKIEFYELATLPNMELRGTDVVYWTRPQLERDHGLDPDGSTWNGGDYVFGVDQLEHLKNSAIILHPLPRTRELPPEVDSDPRARYFSQARYGKEVRTALLLLAAQRDA